jgi:Lipocalin-like domain
MCRVLNSILAVTAVAGVAGFAESSRAPSMEGAWQAVEVSMTGPGARTIRPLQPNLAIFTAKHYSHIDIHADGPRPSLTDPSKASAEELRQAWGPVVAEAGGYEHSRDSLVMHPVVAKNPASMVQGAFTSYAYRIAGDTLWLTMQRTERGPVTNPPTIKFTRVE